MIIWNSFIIKTLFCNSCRPTRLFWNLNKFTRERNFGSSQVSLRKINSEAIPKNLLEDVITAHKQPTQGLVYDKKPFKVVLKPDKKYMWCCCGWSKTQPFCDGSHKNPYIKIDLRPVRFMVEEEKEYYLCNCKQTTHRPFCDGTHKRQDIQEKIR